MADEQLPPGMKPVDDEQLPPGMKAVPSDSGPNAIAPPPDIMRPAATGVGPWLGDLDNDLRKGGGRTFVGRTLGYLQGRGDQGYQGMESNTTPAVADFMGSMPLGAVKLAKGINETPDHPIMGPIHALGGAAQMATIPSMFAAGPAANKLIEAIPSRAHAGQVLNDISMAAHDVPVSPVNTMPALSRWKELTDAGGRAAKPMTKLSNRLGDLLTPSTGGDIQEPFNFPEARDFYSNVTDTTRQSPFQTLLGRGLKPTMLRQAGNVRSGMHADLTDAAETIGRGQDYADAIKEYAQASKLRKAAIGGGLVLGEEAARRTGLLGRAAKAVIP